MGTSPEPRDSIIEPDTGGTWPPAPPPGEGGRARHRTGPPVSAVARPERPQLTDTTPAPLAALSGKPRAASWATSAWGAAALLLTFASVTTLLTRASVTQRLAELLRERDPTVEAATIDTASSSIVFGLLGGAVLATVLVLLTLRRFSRRRRFSRALMVPVWLVVLAVAALAGLVVPTTGWQGWLLLGSMAASVVFVMGGCLAALGPGVSEWLRESRRGHPPGS